MATEETTNAYGVFWESPLIEIMCSIPGSPETSVVGPSADVPYRTDVVAARFVVQERMIESAVDHVVRSSTPITAVLKEPSEIK
ncbi:hypothetical protein AOA80_05510 [Methanomassiliicoccales archaeon RumEn M1]|nr:hypothetical protein AOA80_05510 [Methanomassiliicoccales archaeon RumEn M1]